MLRSILCNEILITLKCRTQLPLHPPFVQMGKTALHDAASKGNAEMVAYMMEQVNPNVDARDVVSREVGISFRPVALYM